MKLFSFFKSFIIVIAVTLVSSNVAVSKTAENYKEGFHFKVIKENKSDKPVLTEVFSFYCPACYSLESVMPDIKSNLPEGMAVERSHVNFLGSVNKKNQDFLTRHLALAKKYGVQERFSKLVFTSIHEFSTVPTKHEEIMLIFKELGISEEDVLSNVLSDGVNAYYDEMVDYQSRLVKNGYLNGVPTLIVNGKYMVNTASLDRANPLKDLNQLISFLSELD